MKLIDLLVRELPGHGGWPDGAEVIAQDEDGSLAGYYSGSLEFAEYLRTHLGMVCDMPRQRYTEAKETAEMVTREQYEAALAASKQVEWQPGALPPEGIECEVKSGKDSWTLCKVVHSSPAGVAFIYLEEPGGCVSYLGVLDSISAKAAANQFRPIRTEAERKGKGIAQQMCNMFGNGIEIDENEGYGKAWLDLYDAIAAGKIPGIKLAD